VTSSTNTLLIEGDFTHRVSCRAGDLAVWLRIKSPFAKQPDWDIVDFWSVRDGDFVSITTRSADLPSWFELRVSEVSGALAHRIGAGRTNLTGNVYLDPIDGPNLWRLLPGDELFFVHPRRAGLDVLCLSARDCALAALETVSSDTSLERLSGAPSGDLDKILMKLVRARMNFLNGRGVPRNWGDQWSLER
jgi:hypothetical protein